MKKNCLFAILTMLLVSCGNTSSITLAPEIKDVNVILLCGQSNAEGNTSRLYLENKSSDPDKYLEGFKNTQIIYSNLGGAYKSRNFSKTELGQGRGILYFGPEIGFAEYLDEFYQNETTYIIKYTQGGTRLYDNWTSPSSIGDKFTNVGELYTGLIDFVDNAINILKKKNLNPTIRAMCWMQGESDADATRMSFYEELEDNFINDVKKDLGKYIGPKGFHFIDAGISQYWAQYIKINEAKKNNVEKDIQYRHYIDTIKAGLEYDKEPENNPDLAHYDALSMIELGKLFAEEYCNLVLES